MCIFTQSTTVPWDSIKGQHTQHIVCAAPTIANLKDSPDPLLVANTFCLWSSELLEVCTAQESSSAVLLSAEVSVDATWSFASDLQDKLIHVYLVLKCRHTPFTNLFCSHTYNTDRRTHTHTHTHTHRLVLLFLILSITLCRTPARQP